MRMTRRGSYRLVLCVVLSSVPWLACGPPTSTCTPSNCSHGCCDSAGQCRAAGSNAECGVNGATCAVCSTGQSCTGNECVSPTADSGTVTIDAGKIDAGALLDSGTPVVDAGADAGIDAGSSFDAGAADAGALDSGVADAGTQTCRVIATWPIAGSFSVYARSPDGGLEHALADHYSAPAAPYDTLEIDVYWAITGRQTGVVIPSVRDLALEPNYSTCTSCVIIRENCSDFDTCAATYLARAGTVSLEDIARAPTGNFKASLANVRFDAWRLGPDRAAPDGGCILLNSSIFDVSH